jgi:hypothetical protein
MRTTCRGEGAGGWHVAVRPDESEPEADSASYVSPAALVVIVTGHVVLIKAQFRSEPLRGWKGVRNACLAQQRVGETSVRVLPASDVEVSRSPSRG